MATISQLCKNGQTVSVDLGGMHPKIAAKRLQDLVEANGGAYEEPRVDREWGRRAAHGLFPELAEHSKQIDYATFVPAMVKVIKEFDHFQGMSPLVPLYWLIEKSRAQKANQATRRAG